MLLTALLATHRQLLLGAHTPSAAASVLLQVLARARTLTLIPNPYPYPYPYT